MTCKQGPEGRVCEAEWLAWAGDSPGQTCSHTGCDSDRTGSWTLPVSATNVSPTTCLCCTVWARTALPLSVPLCSSAQSPSCREGNVSGFHSECTMRAARSETGSGQPCPPALAPHAVPHAPAPRRSPVCSPHPPASVPSTGPASHLLLPGQPLSGLRSRESSDFQLHRIPTCVPSARFLPWLERECDFVHADIYL